MSKKFGASSPVFRLRSKAVVTSTELQNALKNELTRNVEYPVADNNFTQTTFQICSKAAGKIAQWLKDAHPIPRREFLKQMGSKGLMETVGCVLTKIEQNIASVEEVQQMLQNEKISDNLRWVTLAQECERKYGFISLRGPTSAFLIMARPEFIKVMRPKKSTEGLTTETVEAIMRMQVARRLLGDGHVIHAPIATYVSLKESLNMEQLQLLEQGYLPYSKFLKCEVPKADNAYFKEYLAKEYLRNQGKMVQPGVPLSEENIANWMVICDEQTLIAYLFPSTKRNIQGFLDTLERLSVSGMEGLGPKSARRLAELCGCDTHPAAAKLLHGLKGVTDEDKGADPELVKRLVAEAKQAIDDKKIMNGLLGAIGQQAQTEWTQAQASETERLRKAEEEAAQAKAQKEADEALQRQLEAQAREEELLKQQELEAQAQREEEEEKQRLKAQKAAIKADKAKKKAEKEELAKQEELRLAQELENERLKATPLQSFVDQ